MRPPPSAARGQSKLAPPKSTIVGGVKPRALAFASCGLLAEINENLVIVQGVGVPFSLPFVRDVWASAKDRIGDLPSEVVESVTVAYALAAKSNRLVDWEVVLGDRRVEFAEGVGKAAKEVNHEACEAFRRRGTCLSSGS